MEHLERDGDERDLERLRRCVELAGFLRRDPAARGRSDEAQPLEPRLVDLFQGLAVDTKPRGDLPDNSRGRNST